MWLIFPQKVERVELPEKAVAAIGRIRLALPHPIAGVTDVEFWHDPDMGPHGKFDWSGAHSVLLGPKVVFLGGDVVNMTTVPYGLSIVVHELTHVAQRQRYGLVGWLLMKVFCRFLIERWATQNETWVTENLTYSLRMKT